MVGHTVTYGPIKTLLQKHDQQCHSEQPNYTI